MQPLVKNIQWKQLVGGVILLESVKPISISTASPCQQPGSWLQVKSQGIFRFLENDQWQKK